MNSKLTFTWEQARQVVENRVFAHFGEPLKEIQLSLLQDVWEGLTYNQVAQKRYLSANYLRGDLGPKLWQKLSLALGQEVTKTNFKALIEAVGQTDQETAGGLGSAPPVKATTDWLFSAGSVPPTSPFYQERRCDDLGFRVLQQPGSLLQVRSPRGMGKTSLVNQLLHRAQLQTYQTILFDIQSLEADW
ncbi:MAG: AAA-like domain-containing protein, partial [Microcystaceae cyanobacterium]